MSHQNWFLYPKSNVNRFSFFIWYYLIAVIRQFMWLHHSALHGPCACVRVSVTHLPFYGFPSINDAYLDCWTLNQSSASDMVVLFFMRFYELNSHQRHPHRKCMCEFVEFFFNNPPSSQNQTQKKLKKKKHSPITMCPIVK